jgi:hypothetical protein
MPRDTTIIVPGNVSKIITHRDNIADGAPEGAQYGGTTYSFFTPGQIIHFSGARDSKVKIILKP